MSWRGETSVRNLLIVIGASLGLALNVAQAAPVSQIVDQSQLVSTNVSFKDAGRTKRKLTYCLAAVPGSIKTAADGIHFTSIANTIADLKARRIGGAKLATQTALKKAAARACSKLRNISSPTPVPTVIGPKPTATPTGTIYNFDNFGNTTSKGNLAFGIPSGIIGNITRGKSLSNSYCTCHAERTNYAFPTIRSKIALPPMEFDSTQITDSMLADLTAYLNRFNP